jgi:hypothetical protein
MTSIEFFWLYGLQVMPKGGFPIKKGFCGRGFANLGGKAFGYICNLH